LVAAQQSSGEKTVDRWEYLVTYPYTVRHRIAEFFVEPYNTVVDVGTYKIPLQVKPYQTLVSIDPLKTVPGFHGSISEWEASNTDSDYAVVVLGCAIEGNQQEWDALQKVVSNASLVVVEWASDYNSPFPSPSYLLHGFTTIFHSQYVLPNIKTSGFPVYSRRIMVVGTK
jgi:hypothetical protein